MWKRVAYALVLVLAVFAAARWPGTSAGGGATMEETLASQALGGPLRFTVTLPQGYDSDGTRYPVIYFLHGLPAPASGYHDGAIAAQALQGLDRQAILVSPQGARDGDSDPEYLDWGADRNWETALTLELPAWVDSHFRTVADRTGRAIVGFSAGGYGAMMLGLHDLGRFSVIESWSGYFHPTDPTGTKPLDLGTAAQNARASAHTLVSGLRAAFTAKPTFLAFYVGAGDARFRAENVQLDRELTQARVPHVFEIYAGGHDRTLWRREAPLWLELALKHLAAS
jgi:S-formylglutathione hydrolase FrmB